MSTSAKTFRSNKAYGTKLFNSNIEPLDALYGPWDSLDEFIQTVAEDSSLKIKDVLEDLAPGLTIAVNNGDIIEEWWNPIAGKPFVKKYSNDEIQDVIELNIDLERRLAQLEKINDNLIKRLEILESTDFTTEEIEDNLDYSDV